MARISDFRALRAHLKDLPWARQTVVPRRWKDNAGGQGYIPQRSPEKRLDRRLEELTKAVGAVTVGYKRH